MAESELEEGRICLFCVMWQRTLVVSVGSSYQLSIPVVVHIRVSLHVAR